MQHKLKKYSQEIAFDLLGCFIYAVGITCFARPAGFATGGLTGISLIINYLFNIEIGTIQLLLNIPLVIISFRILGVKFIAKTGKTMLILSLLLNIVNDFIPIYSGNPLLAAIYTGVFAGVGMSFPILCGSSIGGTDLLTLSIRKKKPHMTFGTITICIDACILICGGLAFSNIDAVLHGAIAVAVSGFVCDKIIYGANKGKIALIVTDKGIEVSRKIESITGRGSSLLKIRGGYTGKERDMVISAMSKHQIFSIRRAAHLIDGDSFVIISSTDEVFGRGFLENSD